MREHNVISKSIDSFKTAISGNDSCSNLGRWRDIVHMMSVPISSLRAFLATARRKLHLAVIDGSRLNIVIGNESADLDSITSTIVFAYLRSASPAQSSFSSLYIPLLNLRKADIHIRPELLKLLPQAYVDAKEHLLTLDDILTSSSHPALVPEQTQWILVDHNALTGPLATHYASRVVGCIDHHQDEAAFKSSPPQPRIIETSGSCQSLVINHLREAWDSLSSSASNTNIASGQADAIAGADDAIVRATWDAQVAKVALASILMDTQNMENGDKVTEHDRRAVKYLEAKIGVAPKETAWNRRLFFEELTGAKNDVNGMGLDDIFRKDYKMWKENDKQIGVSVAPAKIQRLVQIASGEASKSLLECLQLYSDANGLAVLALMTACVEDAVFKRELLVYVTGKETESFIGAFEQMAGEKLGLEELSVDGIGQAEGFYQLWQQGNTAHSRKQIGPLLRETVKSWDEGK